MYLAASWPRQHHDGVCDHPPVRREGGVQGLEVGESLRIEETLQPGIWHSISQREGIRGLHNRTFTLIKVEKVLNTFWELPG